MDACFFERSDLAAASAINDVDLRVSIDVAHETDAPRAQNAAITVKHQRRTEVHIGLDAVTVEYAARKGHATLGRAEGIGKVLQGTLAALVADGTIEWMIDQQKLEDAGARLYYFGIACRDDPAFRSGRRG